MTTISMHGDYVTLAQFLKMTDLISSGGQAKGFLAETAIKVNGEPDNRRGRKLYPGDRVEVAGAGTFLLEEEPV